MADCSNLITNEDLALAKTYAEKSGEYVESDDPTLTTPLGAIKKTVQGMNDDNQNAIDDLNEQGSLSLGSLGGVHIGEYSTDPLITERNQYVTFGVTPTASQWKITGSTSLNYQIDSTTYPDPEDDPNLIMFNDVTREWTQQNFKISIGTVADIVNLPLSIGAKVFWAGYNTVSDGGNNWGVIETGAHTADGLEIFTIDVNTFVRANLQGRKLSVMKAGAFPGIGTNSERTLAIQKCINWKRDNDKGAVTLPSGQFIVEASAEPTTWPLLPSGTLPASSGCIILPDNVELAGEKGAELRCEDGGLNVVIVDNGNNASLNNLHITNNWIVTGGAGHGVLQMATSIDSNIKNTAYDKLRIEDVGSYGIGLQYGRHENITVSNIITNNTGSDGIDIKARQGTGGKDTANTLKNFKSFNAGLRFPAGGVAGVDVRGQWNISNVYCQLSVEGSTGLRLRPSDGSANNVSLRTNVSNITVETPSNATTGTKGLSLQGRNCNVSNLNVDNCNISLEVSGSGGGELAYNMNISNFTSTNAREYGIDSTVSASDISFVNTTITDMDAGAIAMIRVEGDNFNFVNTTYDNSLPAVWSVSGGANPTMNRANDCPTESTGISRLDSYATATRFTNQVRAAGDADYHLLPQGAGKVMFGDRVSLSGQTITHYVEVKSNNGTVMKLAVLNN
ncbi:hypothetical protein N9878_00965 [bacterium]|nr:hypothetical protein [bacterium]